MHLSFLSYRPCFSCVSLRGQCSGALDTSSFGSCSSSLAFDTDEAMSVSSKIAKEADEAMSESSRIGLAKEKERDWWEH